MKLLRQSIAFAADLLAATYISCCFLRHHHSAGVEHTVVFSRGAFRKDVPTLSKGALFVDIRGEWLKRCMQLAAPLGWFEQVICLGYRSELRAAFPLSLRVFRYWLRTRPKASLMFGGVDYFEVAIFAERQFYPDNTRIVAVFHENYATEFVKNATRALYAQVENGFVFDVVYAYGPPASEILHRFTSDPAGPQAMVMPRLAHMQDDCDFNTRLAQLDDPMFPRTVLLLAFAGIEYLAPICFTATLLTLAELGKTKLARPLVKFKSYSAAKLSLRQAGRLKRHVQWIYAGSVEALVWRSGFTVVFNSISLYEALLGPSIVIMPAYLDSLHDDNILQETEASLARLGVKLDSVVFAHSLEQIETIMSRFDANQIKVVVARERAARKAVVSRKFYLTGTAFPR